MASEAYELLLDGPLSCDLAAVAHHLGYCHIMAGRFQEALDCAAELFAIADRIGLEYARIRVEPA